MKQRLTSVLLIFLMLFAACDSKFDPNFTDATISSDYVVLSYAGPVGSNGTTVPIGIEALVVNTDELGFIRPRTATQTFTFALDNGQYKGVAIDPVYKAAVVFEVEPYATAPDSIKEWAEMAIANIAVHKSFKRLIENYYVGATIPKKEQRSPEELKAMYQERWFVWSGIALTALKNGYPVPEGTNFYGVELFYTEGGGK